MSFHFLSLPFTSSLVGPFVAPMAPPSSWGFDQATAVRVKIHKDPTDGVQVGDRLTKAANFQLPSVPSHFSNGEFLVNLPGFLWVKDWLKLPDHSFKAYLCSIWSYWRPSCSPPPRPRLYLLRHRLDFMGFHGFRAVLPAAWNLSVKFSDWKLRRVCPRFAKYFFEQQMIDWLIDWLIDW